MYSLVSTLLYKYITASTSPKIISHKKCTRTIPEHHLPCRGRGGVSVVFCKGDPGILEANSRQLMAGASPVSQFTNQCPLHLPEPTNQHKTPCRLFWIRPLYCTLAHPTLNQCCPRISLSLNRSTIVSSALDGLWRRQWRPIIVLQLRLCNHQSAS